MNDAPHADEIVKEDVGKVEISGRTDALDIIPETIQELLSSPPLLDHENEEQFLKLFESFRAYAEPENIVDYHLVFNATVCKWEIARYRFMATAVTANQQLAGLKSLFMQTHDSAAIPIAERSVIIDATKKCQEVLHRCRVSRRSLLGFRVDGICSGWPSVLAVAPGPRHHRAPGGFCGKAICRVHKRA